jgi:hypothetical protein
MPKYFPKFCKCTLFVIFTISLQATSLFMFNNLSILISISNVLFPYSDICYTLSSPKHKGHLPLSTFRKYVLILFYLRRHFTGLSFTVTSRYSTFYTYRFYFFPSMSQLMVILRIVDKAETCKVFKVRKQLKYLYKVYFSGCIVWHTSWQIFVKYTSRGHAAL